MIERNQDIGLGIIVRDRTLRDIVGDRRQVAHDPPVRLRGRIRHDRDINEIAVLQAAVCEVALVDEHDVSAPLNPAIAIIHAVDRRVVLFPKHACADNRRLRFDQLPFTKTKSNPGYVTDLRDAIGVKDNKRVFN